MKTLIIYSNSVLFPEAPNFYEFIAKETGKVAAYEAVEKKRAAARHKDGEELSLFKELTQEVLGGTEVSVLKTLIERYIHKYVHPDLKELSEGDFDTIIMGSYPTLLYQLLPIQNFSIGVDLSITDSTVVSFKPVVLYNPDRVRAELEKLGFGDRFTTEPNKFGNLERLVDHVLEEKINLSEAALISNGTSAKPTEAYIPTTLSAVEVKEMLTEL